MGLIPEDVIEEVRQSNDIVTVISESLRLKKQGRNYVGLCPFHNEKTPSFSVSPDKQIYYCFGCGAGGNVISFIMQMEGLSFPEAVKVLAQKAGIEIPENQQDSASNAKLKEREKAFKLNELVKDFYHYILTKHEVAAEARKYLIKRGIDEKTIEKFQLGYAVPGWDNLLKYLEKKGYTEEYLEKQGLVLKKNKGHGYYDRFRNRIMFPIWDYKANVIGFGGRVLDDSLPKYLNSPETNVFNKSTNLYGINFAIPAIRKQEKVIIVEGYLDVITCHQFGIENVVASLGTAMTKEQGKILARYSQDIYISYDSDAAGVQATLRGLEILEDTGCRVKVITVPNGKDPDELIRKKGPESFINLINKNANSLIEYKLKKGMEKYDFATIEGKIRIVSEIIPSLIKIQNEIEREEQANFVSATLGISPHSLWGEIKKYKQKNRKNMGNWDKISSKRDNKIESAGKINNIDKPLENKRGARAKAEENIIKLLLVDPGLFPRVKEELGVNFTDTLEYVSIINYLNKNEDSLEKFEPASLLNHIDDEGLKQKISALMVQLEPPGNKEILLEDYLKVIKADYIKQKRVELVKEIEEAEKNGDEERRRKLLEEFSQLI